MGDLMRIIPSEEYLDYPCSMVAVGCAYGKFRPMPDELEQNLKEDGYLGLKEMNKYVRTYLPIKKRIDYKRGQRPKLKDLAGEKAVVCVLGHFLYLDKDKYYSFFYNDEDDVVTAWFIKED